MRQRYEIEYPFRECCDIWHAGCDWNDGAPIAHGIGKLIITGAKLVKMPTGIMDRVVYVREFMGPDGALSGRWVKTVTSEKFKSVLSGYSYSYTVEEP